MFVCLANDVELLAQEGSDPEDLFLMKWDRFYNALTHERTDTGLRWIWEAESYYLPPMLTHTCAYPGYL